MSARVVRIEVDAYGFGTQLPIPRGNDGPFYYWFRNDDLKRMLADERGPLDSLIGELSAFIDRVMMALPAEAREPYLNEWISLSGSTTQWRSLAWRRGFLHTPIR